jgi:hypothetical protein
MTTVTQENDGWYNFSNRNIDYSMKIEEDGAISVWKNSCRGMNLSVYVNGLDNMTRKPMAKFLKDIVEFISI